MILNKTIIALLLLKKNFAMTETSSEYFTPLYSGYPGHSKSPNLSLVYSR